VKGLEDTEHRRAADERPIPSIVFTAACPNGREPSIFRFQLETDSADVKCRCSAAPSSGFGRAASR